MLTTSKWHLLREKTPSLDSTELQSPNVFQETVVAWDIFFSVIELINNN